MAYSAPALRETPQADQPEERPVATDDEIAMADADSAYADGYAWASDREVLSARECRRLDGPMVQGCRDYVASLAPAEQGDTPKGREF